MDIVKFFPFVADIASKARCIACDSVVIIEIIFSSDADSVRFLVVAVAPTPISLLKPTAYSR